MKLVGLVFLGLIATVIFSILFCYVSDYIFNNFFPRSEHPNLYGEAGVGIYFLIIAPISFLFGSIVTGYFSYHDIENKWTLLAIVPALYVYLLSMSVALIGSLLHGFINNNWSIRSFLYDYWGLILMSLLWYVTSAGGVFLGYYLRERFAKWWYGD